MFYREDTIAAVATPVGEGGIGVIRISGPKAGGILREIFSGSSDGPSYKDREDWPEPKRVYYGFIRDPKSLSLIDEVIVFFFKGPGSYTCEDVAEIQCHGSIVSLRKILELVLSSGASLAEPGEFTFRAFMNGRLDLSQAEAVTDLVKAKTDLGHNAAMSQLEGRLMKTVSEIRDEIDEILIKLVANIEYPEEGDLEEYASDELISEIEGVRSRIDELAKTADAGRVIREGLKVSLIGRPNAGKSSLMNAVLREARSIVTDIPGTTRDIIEETANIKGIPVVISDTAGIRESEDMIEQIGVARSRKAIENADLTIFVIDGSSQLTDEDRQISEYLTDKKSLIMVNKADIRSTVSDEDIRAQFGETPFVRASAKTGEGIDELESLIYEMFMGGEVTSSGSEIFCNIRHQELLEKASSYLGYGIDSLKDGMACDFAESDLNYARDLLGEITGASVDDDIISKVFSRFCLGK